MNTFGSLFRVSVFGESHGPAVGVLLDGVPAGVSLSEADFSADIGRRRPGARGTTPRVEADEPELMSGVFNGKTTGAPLLIMFHNGNVDSKPYEKLKNTPRPGHADLTASQKFGGFNDYRGSGHFSGRLTLCLVAAGVVAKKMMAGAGAEEAGRRGAGAGEGIRIEARLVSAGGSADVQSAVESAMKDGDSVGGVVECKVSGLPTGLGEPFFDSAESLISHIAFAIPAVKGVEFGTGFAAAKMKGSEMNDSLADASGRTRTNNSGGINGGITNGNELVVRIAVKPTSSIAREQELLDVKSGEKKKASIAGRHDACIALRVPVVLEAAVAIALADLMAREQKVKRVQARA
ncbi:Chorismate synthase [uncultured archaeon]|nr:Chorismate synthase [uncultured archaeon]